MRHVIANKIKQAGLEDDSILIEEKKGELPKSPRVRFLVEGRNESILFVAEEKTNVKYFMQVEGRHKMQLDKRNGLGV